MYKKLALLLLALLPAAAQAQWQPADNPIMTKWGENLDPAAVWQEYPRPQLVRDNWLNLNGLWNYAITPITAPAPQQYEGKILVPFSLESALSGVKKNLMPEDKLWYQRTFTIPTNWSGKDVILNFDAVDWDTALWVNNVFVGTHKGCFDRFSFDITGYLNDSDTQEIIVAVSDPTSFGPQARGKQKFPPEGIWYTPVSGIWQTVWLEAVPRQTYIKELKITPDIDQKTVTVTPMLKAAFAKNYQVKVSVLDSGKQVAQAQVRGDKPVTINIDQPKLWSPDSPFLYDLKLTLIDGDNNNTIIEEIDSYFGMRKISMGPNSKGKLVMHLNNQPLFHYGTLDQGWWPDGLLTPPSDEAMRYDIEITKEMGFNMIRKHIKVEPDRWFYWCDKLGMLVWQDMPSGMLLVPKHEDRTIVHNPHHPQQIWHNDPDLQKRSETTAQFEWELRRMIDTHYNYPSIIMWVVFNEGWGQYDTFRITDAVKELDATRLVNAVSGWTLRPCGDVHDIHTYDVKVQEPEYFSDRVSVVGEYGGIGYAVKDHLWTTDKDRNWGYQQSEDFIKLLNDYTFKFDQIVKMKDNGLSGAVYTQTTDVEGEINGLLTYDRKVIKFDPAKMKALHAPVYEPAK
ncbi:MAG: hypothetical protein JW745_03405 [Sedimentisphaerales bacterium]|nr:hypothetical protein [Sedimentisphaerales bacterium]MBN2843831.1 hypothetical protein [Sedimentisphaerales bacterium]